MLSWGKLYKGVGANGRSARSVIPTVGQAIARGRRRIKCSEQAISRGGKARHRGRTGIGAGYVAFQQVAGSRKRSRRKAVHRVTKGIHEVPATFVGPGSIRQEAYTKGIPVADVDGETGRKPSIEREVGDARTGGDFEIVKHGARPISSPAVTICIHQV